MKAAYANNQSEMRICNDFTEILRHEKSDKEISCRLKLSNDGFIQIQQISAYSLQEIEIRIVLVINYLHKGTTITTEYYFILLSKSNDVIREQRPH